MMHIILIVLGFYQASGLRYTMFPRTDTEDAPLTDVGNAPENVPQEIRRQPVFSLPMYKWIRRKDGTSIAVGTSSESECESSESTRENATMSPRQISHEEDNVTIVPTSAPTEFTEISVRRTASCYYVGEHVSRTPSSSTGVTEIRPGSTSCLLPESSSSSVPQNSPTVVESTNTYYSPTSPAYPLSPGGQPAKQPGLMYDQVLLSPTVTLHADDESAYDHDNYDLRSKSSITDVTRLSDIPIPDGHASEAAGRPAGFLGKFAKRQKLKAQTRKKNDATIIRA